MERKDNGHQVNDLNLRFSKKKINFLDSSIPTEVCSDRLDVGKCLQLGDRLCSSNKQFTLKFQYFDGVLVIKDENHEVYWSSKSKNRGAVNTCLLLNGNLIIYGSNEEIIWQTKTNLKGGEIYAKLEDYGNFFGGLTIYQGSIRRWSSG